MTRPDPKPRCLHGDRTDRTAGQPALHRRGFACPDMSRTAKPKSQDTVFDSVTSVALSSALDGLALRQRAIANNIANVNTPNYHAKRVSFEDALAASVADGDGRAAATTSRSLEPTQLNGNNVNLDTETLSNIDTVLRYQFAAHAAGGQFNSIRTAIRTN